MRPRISSLNKAGETCELWGVDFQEEKGGSAKALWQDEHGRQRVREQGRVLGGGSGQGGGQDTERAGCVGPSRFPALGFTLGLWWKARRGLEAGETSAGLHFSKITLPPGWGTDSLSREGAGRMGRRPRQRQREAFSKVFCWCFILDPECSEKSSVCHGLGAGVGRAGGGS